MYERFLKHRLFFRRILFFVDILSIFLFFAGAVVTLWLYANPEYELYRVTEANASNSVEHKIVDDTALQSLQSSESKNESLSKKLCFSPVCLCEKANLRGLV